MPIPKGVSKAVREQMINRVILPDKPPDEDNLAYLISNALKGIVYDDDKRVCIKHVYKFYGPDPKTVIRVRPILQAQPLGCIGADDFEIVDGEDYIEVILQRDEAEFLCEKGAVADFSEAISERNLNIFVRVETQYEEEIMPLIEGKAAKTKKGFNENVKREMEAGKPQKQAVAIAYSKSGEKKSKKKGAK